MIVFILLIVLTLDIIPIAIFLKKKKIRPGLGATLILFIGVMGAMNLVSGIYHMAANEHAYKAAIEKREDILERESDLLALPVEERPEKDTNKVKKDARYFNLELENDRNLASSPWVGVFTFRYATEHFDELYITLTIE